MLFKKRKSRGRGSWKSRLERINALNDRLTDINNCLKSVSATLSKNNEKMNHLSEMNNKIRHRVDKCVEYNDGLKYIEAKSNSVANKFNSVNSKMNHLKNAGDQLRNKMILRNQEAALLPN